jgi:hypothetical protein
MAIHVMTAPFVSIGAVDYNAKLRSVSLTPSDNLADGNTFGTPGLQIPGGAPSWTVSIEWPQEFDTAAVWNVLNPLQGTSVDWIISPATGAASVSNPTATFSAYMPAVPFLDGSVGQTSTMSISMTTIGAPVFATS